MHAFRKDMVLHQQLALQGVCWGDTIQYSPGKGLPCSQGQLGSPLQLAHEHALNCLLFAAFAEVVPGPFELHTLTQPRAFPTSLYNLKLPPEQVLRHLQTTAEWQQVPVLTDADITARATRLGLLPANTLVAKGG